jgi:hypothetical protein
MRIIAVIVLSIIFTNCSTKNNEEVICNEIKITTEVIENRIKLLNDGISNGNKKPPNSRRLQEIKKLSITINENFESIISNNFNESVIDSISNSLEVKFNYIYSDLDRNAESLDAQYEIEFENSIKNLQAIIGADKTNCDEIPIQRVRVIQEQILSTLLSITKTNKYLFNKIEIVPIPLTENLTMNSGDSCLVIAGVFAYDSTLCNPTRYWIDDSLKNKENMINVPSCTRMYFGGKKGIHKVYGEILMVENNSNKWENWFFEYEVK